MSSILVQLAESLEARSFVEIKLGAYRGREEELENVRARPVKIKGESMLSFVTHYQRKDITKNLTPEEGLERLRSLIRRDFNSARLLTTRANFEWQRDPKGKERIRELPPTITQAPDGSHDRRKPRVLESTESKWHNLLGISTREGLLKAGMAPKLRQIERFAEILSHSMSHLEGRESFRAADMGCGKGYLTFATFEFLQRRIPCGLSVTGVEVRPDLVSLCNRAAAEAGFEGLAFVEGEIGQFPAGSLDLLIALHACDTATDDAIHHGIEAGAEWIFVAPCCHKEIRPQIQPPPELADLLRYGIFLERHAEMLTDTMRALLLESMGYRTRVFEFVSTEHSGRNIMIAAQLDSVVKREVARERFEKLKAHFGIQDFRLEQRLQTAAHGT